MTNQIVETPPTVVHETVLFVGGSFDGKWLPIAKDKTVWVVADERGAPQVYIGYFLGEKQEAKLMLHQSLSPIEAIVKLVKGYNPRKETHAESIGQHRNPPLPEPTRIDGSSPSSIPGTG